mmetsp:Transcript_9151/g.16467  ORF Transcript_9151/g.16467 Transcript_9151/m.16467 type:complete len:101 (-) Transcript_9151:400-702(-)
MRFVLAERNQLNFLAHYVVKHSAVGIRVERDFCVKITTAEGNAGTTETVERVNQIHKLLCIALVVKFCCQTWRLAKKCLEHRAWILFLAVVPFVMLSWDV